jgi:hypothetical protein
MSIAPLPATLEYLSGRRFAFYPPIRNIGHNEWLYRRATWSECIVENLGTGAEFSVPRMFLGETSLVEDPAPGAPAMVVELDRELEWRSGGILPCQRRVIELPVVVHDDDAQDDNPAEPSRPRHRAPLVSIRLEPKTEAGAGKWIGVALVLGVVACTIVADVARQSHRRSDAAGTSRAWLQLSRDDDYRSVLAKLGDPAAERTFEEDKAKGGRVFRLLVYPALRFSVVLSGRNRPEARYAETIDLRGHVLGADLPDTAAHQAPLPRF